MKRPALIRTFLTGLLLIGMASYADANLLVNSDFPNGSITNGSFTTASGPYLSWLDRVNWSVQPGGPTGSFAYQDTCNNCTDQLFQAFAGNLAPAGSQLQIDFDYRFSRPAGTQGLEYLKIVGFESGQNWSNAAPTWEGAADVLYFKSLDPTGAVWGDFISPLVPVLENYAAIGVIFQFGGTIGSGEFRAVDNINIERVPEPSTLLLLGSGLLGLVGYGRKRMKK